MKSLERDLLGLLILGIWQGLPRQADNERARRAAPWLSATAVGDVIWVLSAAALNVLGWNGFSISPVAWTLIATVVAVAIAWVVGRLMGHDNIYRAVFVWAFIAIALGQQNPAVVWSAVIAAVAVAAMIVLTLPWSRRREQVAVGA